MITVLGARLWVVLVVDLGGVDAGGVCAGVWRRQQLPVTLQAALQLCLPADADADAAVKPDFMPLRGW
jgi:hypothetical protein